MGGRRRRKTHHCGASAASHQNCWNHGMNDGGGGVGDKALH